MITQRSDPLIYWNSAGRSVARFRERGWHLSQSSHLQKPKVGKIKMAKGQMGCNAVRNVFVLLISYIVIEKSGCIAGMC